MQVNIAPSWHEKINQEFSKPYFLNLVTFVKNAYHNQRIYPPGKAIFKAFDLCSFEATQIVILGQDPYHGPGQANGLCFSVNESMAMPPSLVNIFKEIKSDLAKPMPKHGNLDRWAKQGVLLLNATLTVAARQPGSHQNKGWEQFTDAVISMLATQKKHIVFMLWGAYAQKKASIINPKNHLILSSPHPSPFSAARGFFGNRHFSKANTYLQSHGYEPIKW